MSEVGLERRWVLPDVCLNEGRFLDGALVTDLPARVEVIATSGAALASLLAACAPKLANR